MDEPPEHKRARLGGGGIGPTFAANSKRPRCVLIEPSESVRPRSITAAAAAEDYGGCISSVQLTDFMIHARLDVSLKPSAVNVISGRNGAGKSAILQAIVLALGGDARCAKRGGSNTASFVRHDCPHAVIRVRVNNSGPHPYRRIVLGDAIVVERVLGRNGSSAHAVESADGKVRIDKAPALEEKRLICEHYGIQLDNPTTVLQQEEAKTFFQSLTSKQLYALLVSSTSLQAAESNYVAVARNLLSARDALLRKEVFRREKAKERDEMERSLDAIRNAAMSDDAEEESKRRFIYARELGEMADKQERRIALTRDSLLEPTERLDAALEEASRVGRRLEEAQLQSRMSAARLDHAESRLKQARKEESEAKEAEEEAECRSSEIQQAILRHMKDIRECENAERAERTAKKRCYNLEVSEAQIVGDLAALSRREEEAERQLDALARLEKLEKDRVPLLEDQLWDLDRVLLWKRREESCLQEQLATEKKYAAMMDTSKRLQEVSKVFGTDMDRLVKAVEASLSFERAPIGPIGHFVRICRTSDEDIARAIEGYLGQSLLSGFLVDNENDVTELRRLFDAHFPPHSNPPAITKCSFRGERIVIDADVGTVLHYLDFSNDEVFNHVVLITSAATTRVLPADQVKHADSTFTSVVTTDFYYNLLDGNGDYCASYFIGDAASPRKCLLSLEDRAEAKHSRELEVGLDALKAGMIMLEEEKRDRLVELSGRRAKLATCARDIQLRRGELIDVRSRKQVLLLELADLESAVSGTNKWRREIDLHKASLSHLKEEKDACRRGVQRARQNVAKWTERVSTCMSEVTAAQANVGTAKVLNLSDGLQRANNEVDAARRQVRAIQRDLDDLTAKFDVLREDAARAHHDAVEFADGKHLEVPETRAEMRRRRKHVARERERVVAENSRGMNSDEFVNRLQELRVDIKSLERTILHCRENEVKANEMLHERGAALLEVKMSTFRVVRRKFVELMRSHGLGGRMDIKHDLKTLDISVRHLSEDDDCDDAFLPLASLSGGERSKTIVCLLLSLWDFQRAPFRCLDEWDVFLDESSRDQVESTLLEYAAVSNFQYIFVSPHKPINAKKSNAKVNVLTLSR